MFMTGYLNETLINSSAITADETSRTVDMASHSNFSVQVTWTSSTAAATIKVQQSNDGSNWTDVDASNTNQAISNDNGDVILTSNAVGQGRFNARYLRVFADYTSGTITTLVCTLVAKP